MKKGIILIALIALKINIYSQNETKTKLNIEGQLALTTDGKGIFFNMGGPTIKFVYPKFSFAINMMPSLRFQEDKVKSFVTPMLGFDPQIYFLKDKRFLVSFPAYYNTGNNKWTFTAGLGYVLTKKK